ncbi:hypothetical protein IWQ60_007110 [Tieghemiomyces parasiticus]|uniref:RBR-type E3 ubiquitin transferase n=1 Tax=Tieghemiomyces parasiticus TaxID=78921 RepID=A0A9W8DQ43_9FUNG|nr:hypothetical protein IWQ60_007110 [Tieghemiomyces parasiticus]
MAGNDIFDSYHYSDDMDYELSSPAYGTDSEGEPPSGDPEDEDFYDDDTNNYFTTTNPKDERRFSEVEYQVHGMDDLVRIQKTEADKVGSIFGLSLTHATMMLRSMRWNKDRFLERYTEDPERVQRAAGIADVDPEAARSLAPPVRDYFERFSAPLASAAVDNEGEKADVPDAAPGLPVDPIFIAHDDLSLEAQSKRARTELRADTLCEICFSNEPDTPLYALACGHWFCVVCYHEYLGHKVRDEGLLTRIQCPTAKCPNAVDEPSVEMLVSPRDFQRYQRLLLRSFVDDNDVMRWCPAPDCTYVVECHTPQSALTSTVPTVRCRCGHAFCFGCGGGDHQPCICALAKMWIKKCTDDSETSSWIDVHTKVCVKCRAVIEKNGGCNHMTCRKCGHEFCWVCMGSWVEHGRSYYNCNRYSEKSSQEARQFQTKSRATLKRYLHYYERYHNHELSARLDHQLYLQTEKKMLKLQQASDLSWIEVQFLRDAVDTVVQCRETLKWTYAFAFYLVRNNVTELFEDNQRDLEMATEQLSGLLESNLDPQATPSFRQKVLDKTSYVAARRQVVLEDTARGLSEDRWEFNVSLTD